MGMFGTIEQGEVRVCVLAEMWYQVCIGPDLGNWNDIAKALSPQMNCPLENMHLGWWFMADDIKMLDIGQETVSPRPLLMGLA